MRTLDPILQAAMDSGNFTPFFQAIIQDQITRAVITTLTPIGYELSDLALTFTAQPSAYISLPTFRTTVLFRRGVTVAGVNYYAETSEFYVIDSHWNGSFQTFNCHLFPRAYYTAAGDLTYSQVITAFCEAFGKTAAFLDPDAAWLDYQFYPTGKSITVNDAQQFFNILKQKYFIFATDWGGDEIMFYTAFTHADAHQYHISGYHYSVDYNVDIKRQYIWRDELETIHQTAPKFTGLGALDANADYVLTIFDVGNGIILAGTQADTNCKIFRSTDNGTTWNAGYNVTTLYADIVGINSFVSPAPGVVLASGEFGGIILRSVDYGLTWTKVAQFGDATTNSLTDLGNGIVICGFSENAFPALPSYSAYVYKSLDYGLHWHLQATLETGDSPHGILSMIHLGNGIVVAGTHPHGKIYRSTDWGETFTLAQALGTELEVLCLCSLGEGKVLAGTNNSCAIYKSEDYGLHWSLVVEFSTAENEEDSVYSIAVVGTRALLAASGGEGHLYRSLDNGDTWSIVLTAEAEQIRALIALTNGITVASTGLPGLIYISLNCAAETYPIHNLGFMPSTAVEPSANYQLAPSKFDPFPINLKYQSSDFIQIDLIQGGTFNITCAEVVEILDLSQKMIPWRMVIAETQWLSNTAVGSLPGTIERVASYTPLVTANFNNNFDASINNLQAMADFLDNMEMGAGGGGDVYADHSNVFTKTNPLTTPAESWIGPSSTTGIYFKNGFVGVGIIDPAYQLHVNTALVVTVDQGAEDESFSEVRLEQYGGLFYTAPSFSGWRANGSQSSPTHTNAGDYLFFFRSRGYGDTDFNAGGEIAFLAGDDWSDEAQPTIVDITNYQGNIRIRTDGKVGISTNMEEGGVTYHSANISGDLGFFGWDSSSESPIFEIIPAYISNTHSDYTTRTVFNAWTAAGGVYECMRMEGVSSAKLGFFGHAAAVQPSAFTQTYSTASHTSAALTSATLTDNSGGTANTTLEAIGTSYSQSAVRNNFADLAAMVNKDTADIVNLKQVLTAVIDDLQSMGLLA